MSKQLVGPRVCDKLRERQSNNNNNNNNNKCLASKQILEESEDPVLDELNIVIINVLC